MARKETSGSPTGTPAAKAPAAKAPAAKAPAAKAPAAKAPAAKAPAAKAPAAKAPVARAPAAKRPAAKAPAKAGVGRPPSPSAKAVAKPSKARPVPPLVADLLKIPEADLSDGSKQAYRERLESMAKATGKPMDWCVANPAATWEVMKAVRKDVKGQPQPLKPQTLRLNATAMVSLFKHIPSMTRRFPGREAEWRKLQDSLNEEVKAKYDDQEPSEAQKLAHVEWTDVLAKRDLIAKELPKGLPPDAHLVLSLHSFIAPGRRDWGSIRVFTDSNGSDPAPAKSSPAESLTPNYIVLDSDGPGITLVLTEYKTSRIYGRQERALPAALQDVIRASLAAKPRKWLICKHNGEPYSRNSYGKHVSNILEKLFDRPATVDTLRHSYVNYQLTLDLTPRQMDELAKEMLHGPSMFVRYRLRFKEGTPLSDAKCTMVCEGDPAKPPDVHEGV